MNKRVISLKSTTKIIWKNIIIIIAMTLIFGIAGALYAKHKKFTDYESERNLMTERSYRGASANEEVQADINLGKTYSKIIESDDVAKNAHSKLPESLRKKYNVAQIQSVTHAQPVMQTTIIRVSAKTNSANDSAKIVNAVTEASVNQIHKRVPSAGKISVFSKANANEAEVHTGPSTKKYTLIGAAVGFLFGMIIAFSITTWTKLI